MPENMRLKDEIKSIIIAVLLISIIFISLGAISWEITKMCFICFGIVVVFIDAIYQIELTRFELEHANEKDTKQ